MSRTIRRKASWMARHHIGSFESNYVPTPADLFSTTGETYQAWRARRESVSNEKHYEQRLARYHSCSRRGRGGCPRWWRHLYGSYHVRNVERMSIIRHLQWDDWDNHLPDSRCRSTAYYW